MYWDDDLYDLGRHGLGGFGAGEFGFGIDRRGFASVSERARNAKAAAENLFLEHLAMVDTSNGKVTEEIIQYHMVPDMRKSFSKFVKTYNCTATSRQLTRAEQDKINPNRKSLMWYTSVTVTPEAQKEYLDKNPGVVEKIKKKREAALAAKTASQQQPVPQPEASGSSSKKRTATQASLPAVASTSKAKKAKA